MNYKIAVTVNNREEIKKMEKGEAVDIAEIKLDDIREDGTYNMKMFEEARGSDLNFIGTFPRPAEQDDEKYAIDNETLGILEEISDVAEYIDIELQNVDSSPISDNEYDKRRAEHVERAKELGMDVIVSWHNYQSTPSLEELKRVQERELQAGADIAKICTTAETIEDNTPMLKLLEESEEKSIGWAMGNKGIYSRYLGPYKGGEWVFASIGKKSAPGQLPVENASDFKNISERTAEALLKPFSEYGNRTSTGNKESD